MNNQNNILPKTLFGSLKSKKSHHQLTPLGKQIARLPVDPKIARILLVAKAHDCIAKMLIIVAVLSK